ncbi:helix-turn-helix domain-containing protein [Spirillospora sp. CA-253888]
MPKNGDISPHYASDSLPDEQKLAACMRKLCVFIRDFEGLSQQAISAKLHVAESSLSHWVHARRRPRKAADLKRLYELAEQVAAASEKTLPFTWDHLAHCHQRALVARTAHTSCPDLKVEVAVKPAKEALPERAEPVSELPVPGSEGDRQREGQQPTAWEPFETVESYLRAGKWRDAVVLLERTGRNGSPDEVSSAVITCRRQGHDEAADTIHHHASQREKNFVLALIKKFRSVDEGEEADRILEAALV